jgi:predicted nucleic acid-binding protein
LEIDLNQRILDTALDLMATYQLKSNDAIHVATALAVGATEIATADADFLAIQGIGGLAVTLIREDLI